MPEEEPETAAELQDALDSLGDYDDAGALPGDIEPEQPGSMRVRSGQFAISSLITPRVPRPRKKRARDENALFELSFQSPAPEVPWVHVDTFGELDYATDDARDPVVRRSPGTVYRITQDGHVVWLGVVGEDGRTADAPTMLRNAPAKAPDWVSAWEGPDAKGDWMLRQSGGVERRLLVRAVIEVVRPLVETMSRTDARDRFELVEQWARGEVDDADLSGLDTVRTPVPSGYGPARTAGEARSSVAAIPDGIIAVALAVTPDDAGSAARVVLNRALFVLTYYACGDSPPKYSIPERFRRGFAREVRKTIPLGVFLLSRLPKRLGRAKATGRA